MQKKYVYGLMALVVGLMIVFLIMFFNDNSEDKYGESTRNSEKESSLSNNSDVNLREERREEKKVFSEVWSQHSPYGASYEFKVNCVGEFHTLEECFLWNIERVVVHDPNGT